MKSIAQPLLRVVRSTAILLLPCAAACGTAQPPIVAPGSAPTVTTTTTEPTTAIVPSAGTETAPVSLLLDHFDVQSIVGARARAFTRQVALLAGDLSDAELERLVPAAQEAFAPALLRRDIADFLLAEAPEGRIAEIAAWVETGASGEVERRASAYTPPVPLATWLDTYTNEPPSADRVRLVARWSESRDEGAFFLLLEQALDEAAHAVWAAFRPGAPDFEPFGGDELLARLDRSRMAAVLTALHGHEPIEDTLIRTSTVEYESEAGRWYVETYQLAVAEAMRAAGLRTVALLTR